MSAHRILQDLLGAKEISANIIPDPGNGKTIPITIDCGICRLVSGASAESRVLREGAGVAPDGTEITLLCKTHGGGNIDVTLTDIDGTNTIVRFTAAEQWTRLVFMVDQWKLLVNRGATLA